MGAVIVQLFAIFLPIYRQIQADRAASGQPDPTDDEMIAIFEGNRDKYLQEGAAWLAAHPAPPSQS